MLEREYGVVLSSRSGSATIRVPAKGTRAARKAVQAKIPPWWIGAHGGQCYTMVYVTRLEDFAPGYREMFITLPEAEAIIARDGFISMERTEVQS